MLSVARRKGGNLEMKLYELSSKANRIKLFGSEALYHLLVHLYDSEGIESHLIDEGGEAKAGILYLLEEQVHLSFDVEHNQVAPLSLLIQLERAPELIHSINQHGLFIAEMQEWDAKTHQAHIVLHPAR